MLKKNKGFTLIELIIVIAILGILAAVLVPSISNYVNRANLSVAHANGAATLEACARIMTDIEVGYTTELSAVTIKQNANIDVLEGDSELNNAIVVDIVNNKLQAIWSMKGGQLAMWTIDRGWVFGTQNVAFIDEEGMGFQFALANGNTSYVIKDGRTFSQSALNIPSTYKGLPVIGIANNAFNGCDSIVSVNLPSSIQYIGVGTFNGCSNLTSVTIPSSVTSIGNNAFNGCTSLTSFTVMRDVNQGITTGGTNMFQSTPYNLVIKVPSNSVNAYKAANGWSSYSSKIQSV